MWKFFALLLASAPWFLAPAQAGQPDAARAEETLHQAEQDLAQSGQKSGDLEKAIVALLKEQEELSSRLITAADDVALREQALSDTGNRITALDDEALSIRKELAAKRETLSTLLAGLQRLEQNPPPALAVAPGRILDALRGAMMFGAVVPEMRSEADHLLGRLERLDSIKKETANAKTTAQSQLASLKQARDSIALLLDQRKSMLGKSEAELKAEQARQKQLASRAANLRQLLASLATEEARKSEQEKAAAAELARLKEELARPHVAIAKAKGRLEYPAQGAILARFGQANGTGSSLAGIVIATAKSAQVRSPADAKIAYAGAFRSYGQLLILDGGDGYLLLLAGLKRLDVSAGQLVRAGEPLGIMGEKPVNTALYDAGVPVNRAVLYVELRKNGEAVDSSGWWIGSTVEANAAGKSE